MSAPRLTKEQKNKIVAAYIAGRRIHAIATEFGVHFSYPGLLAARRGVSRRNNHKNQKPAQHAC